MKQLTLKQFFKKYPYLKRSLFAKNAGIHPVRLSQILSNDVKYVNVSEAQLQGLNQFLKKVAIELSNVELIA